MLSQKHIIKSVIWLLPLDKSVLLVTFYSLQELDECGVKKIRFKNERKQTLKNCDSFTMCKSNYSSRTRRGKWEEIRLRGM